MMTSVKKFNIFLILTFGLILMSLIFPQNRAYANGLADFVYDFLTGDGNIGSEFFERVIEDTVEEGINIVGFDTHRFETEEQAAKFRAAIISQQVKNLVEDFMNSKSLLEKGEIITNLKQHLSNNLQKSVEQVNQLIEEKGGNIDLVELELENYEVFGYAVGKKIINMFKDVTPDDYENLRKLDEQLMREAYAELGVADLPQDILEGLFEMSNNQESFMDNFKNMSQSDKEWFEKTKAYYAYSAQLTNDAVNLMEAAGLSNLDELRQFYMNNKHQIKNMNDLRKLTQNMQKDRQNLLDLLKNASPVDTKEALMMSGNQTEGHYILDNGILNLYAFTDNQYNDISINGTYGGLKFDSTEAYEAFMIAWEKFKQDYNWEFTQSSPDFQRLFTFYQSSPEDLDDPIKLAGKVDVEYHTFVSKVIFKITKKKGSMGNIDVADMATLNDIALKYNKKFAQVYERLTGNASPVPKVTKTGNSVIVELDYYEGIENNNSRVYDAIRNNWSLIVGKHNRPSLDYKKNGSNEGFVPTIAFTNVKERGVYEVEAIVFGSRFYQYEDSYTIYTDCWIDEDGQHHHGSTDIIEYFPYREEVRDTVHGFPRNNDQRNIAPDHIVRDNVIAKAIWEVNVSEMGKIIIPVYGVKTSTDIKVSNFITK